MTTPCWLALTAYKIYSRLPFISRGHLLQSQPKNVNILGWQRPPSCEMDLKPHKIFELWVEISLLSLFSPKPLPLPPSLSYWLLLCSTQLLNLTWLSDWMELCIILWSCWAHNTMHWVCWVWSWNKVTFFTVTKKVLLDYSLTFMELRISSSFH